MRGPGGPARSVLPVTHTTPMKKYAGLLIGAVWILLAFGAFSKGIDGWSQGHMDLAVWWSVIGGLLAIAGTGALLGTWIHAWADEAP